MASVPDWLLLTATWLHLMGAVAWVGGSIFFKFVLQPALRKTGAEPGSMRAVGHEFGSIVRIAIGILVVTGAFMALVHLSAGGNSRVYIGILALKIALAFYMFFLVWLRRRQAQAGPGGSPTGFWPRLRRSLTGTTALLILGVVVIGLADVLGAVGGHGAGGSGGGHHHGVEANGQSEVPDTSGDHHEPPEAAEAEAEVQATPTPTEEANGADDHHHGDDNGDGHAHSH